MEPDFGSWQTPDISRSHLYRGTIAWTPPTAIYRAYTVSCITLVSLYLNRYVHNDLISDLDLFHIPEAIFTSDQAALWKVLSIFPSVCYTFFTMFLSLYHHEVITCDRSDVMQKVSQRSKVKVTEVKTNFASIWALLNPNSSLNSQMAMIWCTMRFFNISGTEKLMIWIKFDQDLSRQVAAFDQIPQICLVNTRALKFETNLVVSVTFDISSGFS